MHDYTDGSCTHIAKMRVIGRQSSPTNQCYLGPAVPRLSSVSAFRNNVQEGRAPMRPCVGMRPASFLRRSRELGPRHFERRPSQKSVDDISFNRRQAMRSKPERMSEAHPKRRQEHPPLAPRNGSASPKSRVSPIAVNPRKQLPNGSRVWSGRSAPGRGKVFDLSPRSPGRHRSHRRSKHLVPKAPASHGRLLSAGAETVGEIHRMFPHGRPTLR